MRTQRFSTIAANLALILSAGASSVSSSPHVAGRASPSPAPAPGPPAYGNDISWPQCPTGGGGYGLPGPMASASFAVLGLTDGGSWHPNPCLAAQVASAHTRHLWTGAYAIVTYPTSAQLTRYGTVPAVFNLATMARAGLDSPMIWVDVEPRTKAPWSASPVNNNAVIDDVIARYEAAGARAGLYSFDKAWKAITGGRVLPSVPTWVPVGHRGGTTARATCALASYSGSKPWLTQWTDDVRDHNLTCPVVTGRGQRQSPVATRQIHTTGARLHGRAVRARLSGQERKGDRDGEPAGQLHEPVPVAAQGQPGRLVAVGTGGSR